MKRCKIALFCLFLFGLGYSTVYYVATDGNDSGPGTIGQPWKTLQKACQTLVAGDTVYLRGGTYPGYGSARDDGPTPLNSGTEENPITFAAYPGETAIIRPSSNYTHAGFVIKNHSYITIDGLEISHCSWGVLFNMGGGGADNIVVQNCHIHDCEPLTANVNCAGIYAGSSQSNPSTNCQFLNNLLHDNRGPSTNACGIEMYDMHNTTIRGNIVYNQTGVGIWMKYRCHNNDVSQNIIGGPGYGIWAGSGSDNCDLHENIIYGCGAGFRLGVGAPTTGTKVYNNVIDNSQFGIVIDDGARDQIIYNNIVCGCAVHGISEGYLPSDGTIAYIGYNNVYNCTKAYNDVEEGENSIQLNPRFMNSANRDYHLLPVSPCKGIGRYGEDMGAYPGGPSIFNGRTVVSNGLDADTRVFSCNGAGFSVQLSRPGEFMLNVYDISGRKVWQYRKAYAKAGTHRVSWNRARPLLASGVCLVRMQVEGFSGQTRVLRVR